MQYKTTIEVCTEAADRHEAADIAGEFLRGTVSEGTDVKVRTVSVTTSKVVTLAIAACSTIAIIGSFFAGNQIYSRMAKAEQKTVTSYAIQPPLNTNISESQGKEFKEIWQRANKDYADSLAK